MERVLLLHRLKQQKWEEKFWQSIRELQEALDVPFPSCGSGYTYAGIPLCAWKCVESSSSSSVSDRVESKIAMDKYGIKPDIIIGCAGGGSNLGGLISPFMGEKLRGEKDYHFIAVEPASCPSLTRGVFAYDFCDTGMVCPLAKMYTLGSGFIPSANHAGGLRYHGMSPVAVTALCGWIYGSKIGRTDSCI